VRIPVAANRPVAPIRVTALHVLRQAGSGKAATSENTTRNPLGGSAGLVAPLEGSRTAVFAVQHPAAFRRREDQNSLPPLWRSRREGRLGASAGGPACGCATCGARTCFRGERRVPPIIARDLFGTALATTSEISKFLAETERRAFKQAIFATRDEDAALDIVQDAMMKLTEKYSDKPAGELPMLFARILQNTIHDHFRRQKVRNTWTTLLSSLGKGDEKDEEFDPLESLLAKSNDSSAADPARQLEQAQVLAHIEQALSRLPARQREAFLLRYWEELDVAEAAAAMGCSEGSVKTHCSRAVHALAGMLSAKGLKL
jgi:RNA polymerase sigma-70 factor (ECF subfamily)